MAAEALILDFGGVITRTLFETHARTEHVLGLAPGTLTWRGPFDAAGDVLWRTMQENRISERDYWHRRTAEVAALVGADWTEMADFVRAVRGADPEAAIRPEALAAIATAKAAGKRLAILSNELDLFYDVAFRRQLPWLADFEVIHDATHTGILKPDAAAYRDCLATLGLPAEACVFVEDQPRNVAGADAVGLKTVAFDVRRPAASFDRALELLGLKEFSHA